MHLPIQITELHNNSKDINPLTPCYTQFILLQFQKHQNQYNIGLECDFPDVIALQGQVSLIHKEPPQIFLI